MTSYILTPPSSNEDSSCMSPSSPNNVYTEMDYVEDQNCNAHLVIREQPVDKFRFRYKSEMAGTHGSLTGINFDKARKQTFPTAELVNYEEPAVIRCTLYQYSRNSYSRQPHAHRLVRKHGAFELDDPHSIHVSKNEGYIASFHSMGIIHTAKKYVPGELYRKKKILKSEELSRQAGHKRELTQNEDSKIKNEAEAESKSINLNIVCLRFDAYRIVNDIWEPICKPVYSHAINNLKSALTGELKIVRMNKCVSQTTGNEEVFILVEKVTKKNIKIRFFQLDDDDNEIWCGEGKFNDLDVHHQYAIVFKTPAYKDLNILEQIKVFIELWRPSDGARSEPKEFMYIPSRKLKTGTKRVRISDSLSSSDFSSSELPATIKQYSKHHQFEDFTAQLNSEELDLIIKELGPFEDPNDENLQQLMEHDIMRNLFAPPDTMKIDGADDEFIKRENDDEDCKMFKEIPKEIISFLRNKPNKMKVQDFMEQVFQQTNANGFNIFHLAIIYNSRNICELLLKILNQSDKLGLLNRTNKFNETPLHVAINYNREEIIKNLLFAEVDCHLKDKIKGNTALHLSVTKEYLKITHYLLQYGNGVKNTVNEHNHDGYTPLHIAVKINSYELVKLLCDKGADVNIIEKKSGRACLHLAIADQAVKIVKYLIEHPNVDLQKEDYSNTTPYMYATALLSSEKKSTEVYDMVFNILSARGLLDHKNLKVEVDEMCEKLETEEIFVKSEFSQDQIIDLYKNVAEFSSDVLDEISKLLDSSKSYVNLASLLDLEHLLAANVFEGPSPSRKLLQYAIYKNGDSIFTIRNFLENLEENLAVQILDKMACDKSS